MKAEKGFPVPENEARRLQVLEEASLLDTTVEDCYDRYTHMAARILKVSHVDFLNPFSKIFTTYPPLLVDSNSFNFSRRFSQTMV